MLSVSLSPPYAVQARDTVKKNTRRRGKVCILSVLILCCITAVIFVVLRQLNAVPSLRPFLTQYASITPLDSMASDAGDILRYDIDLSRGTARAWVFPDGSVFWCESSTTGFSLDIRGFSAESGAHLNESDTRSPFLVHADDRTILIQPPLARRSGTLDGINYIAVDADNGSVAYQNGTVQIRFQGETADWWAYIAPESIESEDGLDWLYRCTVEKFGAVNRMTTDGYYYTTPTDYTPSGDNCFYRIPAAYIPSKLARWSGSHHGRQIAAAMLDLQVEHYNDLGYIPTLPQSGWLSRDYEIGAGFYDTRFNTDIAHALLALGEATGISRFTDHAMTYAAFLIDHAENHAFPTDGGILVEDYSHPDGNLPTHISLNHQLAEILFLFETGDEAAVSAAQKMLTAIEDTAPLWIRDDGNLHYACYPDGTYGGSDYPYLTYNDLLALNRYLGGNEALERLMDTKRTWMDENGITEYNK